MSKRIRLSSGTRWEKEAGYSRGVKVDNQIFIAGTTAMGPDGLVGKDDPAAQTNFIIDKIEASLQKLDGKLADLVRIGVYVSDIRYFERVTQTLGKRLGDIRPVNTLVEGRLVAPEFLVEIEAQAIIGSSEVEADILL